MKVMLYLLPALFLISSCASLPPAQRTTEEIKKADAIYIYTDKKPKNAYRRIAQVITDNGFTIKSSDAVLMNISTEYKKTEATFGDVITGGGFSISVNASIRDESSTLVKLTGKWTTGDPYTKDKEVFNSEMDNYAGRAWKVLKEIANEYNGTKIEYSRNL